MMDQNYRKGCMNKGLELIIFDCDGVLIDSESVSSRVEAEELRRYGCDITVEAYLEIALGLSEEEEIWGRIAAEHGVRLPPDFVRTIRSKVAEAFEKELQPIPGIAEVLSNLDTPICVASGSRLKRVKRCLTLTGLAEFFADNIFSASEVEQGKPHPALFLYAAGKMGADPARCIVVEDSLPGVQGARAAGMTVLGFLGATHQIPELPEKLLASGSAAIFDDMRQFPALCRELQATMG
jgi:HAD superfamily hydrolase (TIGR01509 family)